MRFDKTRSFIPQGARPPVNPHSTSIDHSVWSDSSDSFAFARSPPSQDGRLQQSTIPISRTRSAQQIPSPTSQPRYYYEDYADSTSNAGKPDSRDASHRQNYQNPSRPQQHPDTSSRWLYPERPDLQPPALNVSSSTPPVTSDVASPLPLDTPSSSGATADFLDIPPSPQNQRMHSHRSTMSQERGDFAMYFNRSETSLNAAGALADVSGPSTPISKPDLSSHSRTIYRCYIGAQCV